MAADEVQKLVDSWLEVQNTGNAKEYAKLYAKRMTGIKRVGPRSANTTASAG
jgi:outer membrane receptor for Fe3+-dicitrate